MKKTIFLLFLSKILSTEAIIAETTRYISGNLSRVDWHHESCTFTINGQDSPSQVPNYRLCKVLEQAYARSQGVVMEIKEDSQRYRYSVNFIHRSASWPNVKVEKESFLYQLFGIVEDIYYHSPDDRCYIAIDTGYPMVRNSKHFHLTMVWDVCAKALNAFYSREKVLLMATVDLHTAYTNNIVDLQLADCS